MTWVKGTTTWANCVSDLTKLACGEIADGSSVTVASGDQWIRETGGQDLLRTPASKDVALGNMSTRQGYFTLHTQTYTTGLADSGVPTRTVVRLTNIATSNPATTAGRWIVSVRISVVNSVSGNYSTASLVYNVFDADTGTVITGSTASPNAGGVATLSNGMQVTVSDPSGFLQSSGGIVNYSRGFSTTYVGGVDYWGIMYARRSGAATFSVNPTGTTVTDWDVVSIPTGFASPDLSLTPGGIMKGLGIKTNTGLSGSLYTCTWSAALNKIRLVAGSGGTNGQINLEVFNGGDVDTVFQNPTYRTHGLTVSSWLRPYQTPASVTNASVIQYWMSVKSDKIVIVLNGDPAQTGKLTCNWVGTMTPQFTSYDKFPVILGSTVLDYTADNQAQSNFNAVTQFRANQEKKRQDGSESPRDWQTGWMRSDFASSTSGTDTFTELGVNSATGTGFVTLTPIGFTSSPSNTAAVNTACLVLPPARQMKPFPTDGNWWLYNAWFSDQNNLLAGTSSLADVHFIPRGKVDGPWYFIPGDGWGSGDELTDTNTSKVYFLISADYHRVGARLRTAANAFFGGAAILEE